MLGRAVVAVVSIVVAASVRADDARLLALVDGNALLAFSAAEPGRVERVDVKGVRGTLVGIDCRPSDGRLYGLGTAYDLYTLEPARGAATAVSTLTLPFDGGP